ncbi:MAG: LptF/LptG family permease [Candidatus Gastranaerophilales bacterium]|nr:LptF/LptG family permease [Candidatus Gastranaerophilales bacterium]
MIKLIDKYIFKQVLSAAIVFVLLFVIVWISPEILFRIIRQTVYGEITTDVAFKLFFLEIPLILGKAIPVGALLGSLFVFDRMSRDSEITILRGIGISLPRMIIPVFVLSLISTFICFYTYDTLIPYSRIKIKELKNSQEYSQFVYVDKDENQEPKQIVIVSYFDEKIISGLNILSFSKSFSENIPVIDSIVMADTATYQGDYWLLNNGKEYKIETNGVYKQIEDFYSMKILKGASAQRAYKLLTYSTKRDSEMKLKELTSHISLLKSEDFVDEYKFMLNKYYQRYSQAFSCILLGICGVLLGINKPRENRLIGFTIAAALVFMFYIIVPFLDLLTQNGVLIPVVAAWIPCLLIFLSMIGIFKLKQI